jgi:hypothetical protein
MRCWISRLVFKLHVISVLRFQVRLPFRLTSGLTRGHTWMGCSSLPYTICMSVTWSGHGSPPPALDTVKHNIKTWSASGVLPFCTHIAMHSLHVDITLGRHCIGRRHHASASTPHQCFNIRRYFGYKRKEGLERLKVHYISGFDPLTKT